jgi:RNA polymerase sigma-70 factor, ECF subfamily
VTGPALQLIHGGKEDDGRSSLRELYAKYGGSVFGRCHYLLKDRASAEDAMQDVFAKALVSWEAFRSDASPLTWLMRIATNHCLNALRSDKAGWRGQFESQERGRGEGAGGPQIFELRDAVRKALEKFDVETQAAVVHYHVDEMTLEEVAALLGRSVPTIRKRLQAFASASGQDLMP